MKQNKRFIYPFTIIVLALAVGFGYTNCGDVHEITSNGTTPQKQNSQGMTALPAKDTYIITMKDGTKIQMRYKKGESYTVTMKDGTIIKLISRL
ncbi:MAG: hypothetical protein KDD46_02235 [Bdellovibrionales bacterium]|nr:hypothetical protein [Bdellovibrionales bacterium]